MAKPIVGVPELPSAIDIYKNPRESWAGAVLYGNASSANSGTEGAIGFGAYQDRLFVLVEDRDYKKSKEECGVKDCWYGVNIGVDQRVACDCPSPDLTKPEPIHWLFAHVLMADGNSKFCIQYSTDKFSEHLPIHDVNAKGSYYIGSSDLFPEDHFIGQYEFEIVDRPPKLPPEDLKTVPPIYRGTVGWHTAFGIPKENRGLPIVNQKIQDGNSIITELYNTNRDEWKGWADLVLPVIVTSKTVTETKSELSFIDREITKTKTETVTPQGYVPLSEGIRAGAVLVGFPAAVLLGAPLAICYWRYRRMLKKQQQSRAPSLKK